jgi:hypothetical protein
MKKGFLNKKPMANAGNKAMEVAEIGVGTTGAAYLSNKVIGAKFNPKYHGLAFLALGIAGNMFVADPHLNNIAKGIGGYGVLRTTGDFILPKQKDDLGLRGIGAASEVDWDELAAKAKAKAEGGVEGVDNPEDLSGRNNGPAVKAMSADSHDAFSMMV